MWCWLKVAGKIARIWWRIKPQHMTQMTRMGKDSTHYPAATHGNSATVFNITILYCVYSNMRKSIVHFNVQFSNALSVQIWFLRLVETYLRHSFTEGCELPTSLALAPAGLLTLLASSMSPAWPHVPCQDRKHNCRVPSGAARLFSPDWSLYCASPGAFWQRTVVLFIQVWQHRKAR